jgi:hypothetical protein
LEQNIFFVDLSEDTKEKLFQEKIRWQHFQRENLRSE